MSSATGIGSMPGEDFAEALKVSSGLLQDLPFIPELPARGPHAGMIGRTLGLITDLGADLQPDGWRIGVGRGLDQRRARSLLRQDLDVTEEAFANRWGGQIKVQVAGPLTLAAAVERPRGDKMLADHGARRELSEVLAAALADHLTDLGLRFLTTELVVQIDEPALNAVLDATVPTASGWGTHRRVDPPEADELLRRVVDVVRAVNATPVLHTCGPDVPIELVRGAGFQALSFDPALARPDDVWAEAFDQRLDLWFGALPTDGSLDAAAAADRVRRFVDRLGFPIEDRFVAERLVVTTACGLASSTPEQARHLLAESVEAAARLEPS